MEGVHQISIVAVIVTAIAVVLIFTVLAYSGIAAAIATGAFRFLAAMLRRDEFPYLFSSKDVYRK
jgi:hypothetical protein